MSALERTAIGGFCVENAITVEKLSAATLTQYFQPALAAVADLPHVTLSDTQLFELRHGRPILFSWLSDKREDLMCAAELVAVDSAGQLAAILFAKRPGELWPRMNFNDSAGS